MSGRADQGERHDVGDRGEVGLGRPVILAHPVSELTFRPPAGATRITAEFGLKGHVQFRTPGQTITLTENGPASPLEESVFDKMLGMGRIFS